ncbi:MAG TPA: Rossmann-like and DUF2520 domain-containing protein [Flavobacteriales bacterium]
MNPAIYLRTLLIGTGRAAFHLGHALRRSGAELIGVVGRDAGHAATLAKELRTSSFTLDDRLPTSDLRLLAVSDDAIAEVAARLPMSDGVIAHTSGTKPFDLLGGHRHRGVLWPIQSLSPGEPADLRDVPIVIEGEDDTARELLRRTAGAMSGSVIELPLEQRQVLHLAAVISSNFPVALLQEAQRLLVANGIAPHLVVPLWKGMAAKAAIDPEKALTGPARRGDRGTIQQHLDRLKDEPDLRAVYAALSELIRKTHLPDA